MNKITKVSDISPLDLAEFLRIADPSENDLQLLESLLNSAVSYVKNYTGLNATEVDSIVEFIDVVFILVQDMYDNRTLYVDNQNVNKVVDSILGMHSINLL